MATATSRSARPTTERSTFRSRAASSSSGKPLLPVPIFCRRSLPMPARLSGVLDWSGGFLHARRQEHEWERRYPAPAPWKRTARRADGLKVVIDLCGDSSLSRCLAIDDRAKVGVAGHIRLDRSAELHAELGGDTPGGDAGLVVAAYLKWGARS